MGWPSPYHDGLDQCLPRTCRPSSLPYQTPAHHVQEPELCWPTGDVLVYLRDPGQSSRGPAFQVHSTLLKANGFESLLEKCMAPPAIPATTRCILPNCQGCDKHSIPQELYLPAPPPVDLDALFDFHITTRNFFAWLYNRPLAGRGLGRSLVALTERINAYRPDDSLQNKLEVITYAESQKYLDFRECIDHALAALHLAEKLEIEDLWVDAFAHCVGLGHRGLRANLEYAVRMVLVPMSDLTENADGNQAIGVKSRALITQARVDMEARLDRVQWSVTNFFEDDLSGMFLRLPEPARDHLDRFRSFLHTLYIEQHGFWPPERFEEERVQKSVYSAMYTDFRNLYSYLVDPNASTTLGELGIPGNGEVCTLQSLQAFDLRHHYDPLPRPLPLLPDVAEADLHVRWRSQRRNSWNLLNWRKADRETRIARCTQALMDSTNRDPKIMNCLLVRRYSEFELQSVDDDLGEGISLVDARKVRWIVIYAVLQTLIAVLQAPKQVRNTQGLTYSLCCRPPKVIPWHRAASPTASEVTPKPAITITPDTGYSHTNTFLTVPEKEPSRTRSWKERRKTLSVIPGGSWTNQKKLPTSVSTSFKRFMLRRSQSVTPERTTKRASFCEIYVQGYGNGLNEVRHDDAALPAGPSSLAVVEKKVGDESAPHLHLSESDSAPQSPRAMSPSRPIMSRESSSASNVSSTWSQASRSSDTDVSTPAMESRSTLKDVMKTKKRGSGSGGEGEQGEDGVAATAAAAQDQDAKPKELVQEHDGSGDGDGNGINQELFQEHMPTVHFNAQTWDAILSRPTKSIKERI